MFNKDFSITQEAMASLKWLEFWIASAYRCFSLFVNEVMWFSISESDMLQLLRLSSKIVSALNLSRLERLLTASKIHLDVTISRIKLNVELQKEMIMDFLSRVILNLNLGLHFDLTTYQTDKHKSGDCWD